MCAVAGRDRPAGADAPKSPAPANLRDAKIVDLPTRISVPISADDSLVLGLPEHFWIQCPRNSTNPTCLAGDGVTVQYVDNLAHGKTHSLLYAGSVPLPDARGAESAADRAKRGAALFLAALPVQYARVDWALRTEIDRIRLGKTTVKVDGKPVPAWRTSKYGSIPAGNAEGIDPNFTGEFLLFNPAGTESLAYIVVDTKGSGISLDKALEAVSVQKTNAANRVGNLVQLNDIMIGKPAYPVRLAAYTSPAGFVPTQRSVRAKDEFVYAEERLDEKGVATASYQIQERDAADEKTLEQEAEISRGVLGLSKSVAPVSIELATKGAFAVVFRYRSKVGDRDCPTATAVIAMEDKIWHFTWFSLAGEAQEKADAVALEALLRSMQVAIR